MRIVNFLGGLENQIFIFALYKHLKGMYTDDSIFECYNSPVAKDVSHATLQT